MLIERIETYIVEQQLENPFYFSQWEYDSRRVCLVKVIAITIDKQSLQIHVEGQAIDDPDAEVLLGAVKSRRSARCNSLEIGETEVREAARKVAV